mgnify:FL=1
MFNLSQKIKKYISLKYNNGILRIKLKLNKERINTILETRLAETKNEIKAAQQLRYRVFYKEL